MRYSNKERAKKLLARAKESGNEKEIKKWEERLAAYGKKKKATTEKPSE